jgi:probable HAF family extracellular repeat protein
MTVKLLAASAAVAVIGLWQTGDMAAQSPGRVAYAITDLGSAVGGPFSQATYVTSNGLTTGLAVGQDGAQHALLWTGGVSLDISSPALGGPNSGAFGANERGQVDGIAESLEIDPNGENFCGYFTAFKCLPFLWQNGVMTALPLLGGNNGQVSIMNNRGEIAGAAETTVIDPSCPTSPAINGTGPQVLDYEPVVWGPKPGSVRTLQLLPGDTVGMALWINDHGETVGFSSTCATGLVPPFAAGAHAVMWDASGVPHDLGNLGGTFNPGALAVGNVAFAINNGGQVTGVSALPGDTIAHGFIWTARDGMRDLGTLPGDMTSAGLGINNAGDVVGSSIDTDVATGNPRAVIWRHGEGIADLNTLVPAGSPLYLLTAFTINDRGAITGFGFDPATGAIHAFLATPVDSRQ